METPNIQTLARIGAEQRYRELQAEIATLLSAFPDLDRASAHANVSQASAPAGRPSGAIRRRRPKWSAQARKAVSLRMTKYWAARRREKK
jgi:hypothetical protein